MYVIMGATGNTGGTVARDIGSAAAKALLALDFSDKQTRELLGQRDLSYVEATTIIGETIGKPKHHKPGQSEGRGAIKVFSPLQCAV